MLKETKIDRDSGKLYINGLIFPSAESPRKERDATPSEYSSSSVDNVIAYNFCFHAKAFFKNNKLRTINIGLETQYINTNCQNENGFNMESYINYCREKTDKLLTELIGTKKRTFAWGKTTIIIDPREPYIFAEIRYYK